MKFAFVIIFCAFKVFAGMDEFSAYIDTAANTKLGMGSRWNALIKAAEFASLDQVNLIRNFASDKDWYMRNASLIALVKISPVAAVMEAKKLLYDKALVVRSAAVEVLGKNLTPENKTILAEEMQKPYNFNKKSSLWIRKQIVEKLAHSAEATDRDFFAKSLFDSDQEIAQLSAATLSKITGQRIEGRGQIEKWQSLVKQNNWL